MKNIFISILLYIYFFSSSAGQDVTVTSSFDSSGIYVGDQIRFLITVDQPADLRLELPSFKDTLIKNIDILSGPVYDSTKTKDGRIRIVEKYLITSFDSGHYQIPPVFVQTKNADGFKRFYSDYSQLIVMRYKIAPADTALKIYDIIKPYRAPVTAGEVLPWILLVALLFILIWFAVRFIRRLRKSKKEIVTIINPDPAHVIAFRELEKLKEKQLWQKGQIKNFYTELTEILRRYLENRFNIYSLELTTSETLDKLVKSGFKKDVSYNQLKIILTGADLVKFAKYNPEPSENESHYQNSWDFVQSTKQNETVIGEPGEEEKIREGNK